MRILAGFLALWLAAVVIAGVVGDAWILRQWRTGVEDSFRQDVQATIAVLRFTDWQSPPESDPRWVELEQLLNLDVVPSRRPRAQEEAPAADDAASAPPTPPASSKLSSNISWTRSVTGQTRVSSIVSGEFLEGHNREPEDQAAEFVTLRVTRELAPARYRYLWWSLWSSCNLLGVVFGVMVLRFYHLRTKSQQLLLAPWVDATRTSDAAKLQLPTISDFDTDLEPALSIIAERINRLVSDLGNANARSDLVLGNLQEGVLAVDDHSQVLLANNALRNLLELQEDYYLYRPLFEVIRLPVIAQLVDFVLDEQAQREAQIEFGTPSKSLRLLARPLPLGGDRTGALLTVRDETLLKRIESIRRDFVANASHELKTPLAAIRAYAETLQMGALDDRVAAERFVANIIAQADRINGLVQGMLQLSRVQAGTALRIKTFNTLEALDPCIAAAAAMADAKGVELRTELPTSPLTIRSDRDGFQTIVSNLLSNAVRYTPAGGAVSLAVGSDAGQVVLTVSDTGIGMRADDLERIFERFYRAEKDRSTDTGGTGLGLSIVKHLVQALEGNVTAESQRGVGSRFEVRLPLGKA